MRKVNLPNGSLLRSPELTVRYHRCVCAALDKHASNSSQYRKVWNLAGEDHSSQDLAADKRAAIEQRLLEQDEADELRIEKGGK